MVNITLASYCIIRLFRSVGSWDQYNTLTPFPYSGIPEFQSFSGAQQSLAICVSQIVTFTDFNK